jgi:hypothetical protein
MNIEFETEEQLRGEDETLPAIVGMLGLPDGRPGIVDITFVTSADERGRALLLAWHQSGARIIARSSESPALAEDIVGEELPLPTATPGWPQRLRHLLRHSTAAVTFLAARLANRAGGVSALFANRPPSPEDIAQAAEIGDALVDVAARLPERLRQAFTLSGPSGLSIQDAAKKLGLTVQATKTRLFRARLLVRSELKEMYTKPHRTRNVSVTENSKRLKPESVSNAMNCLSRGGQSLPSSFIQSERERSK